jgi:hypothetical protein
VAIADQIAGHGLAGQPERPRLPGDNGLGPGDRPRHAERGPPGARAGCLGSGCSELRPRRVVYGAAGALHASAQAWR